MRSLSLLFAVVFSISIGSNAAIAENKTADVGSLPIQFQTLIGTDVQAIEAGSAAKIRGSNVQNLFLSDGTLPFYGFVMGDESSTSSVSFKECLVCSAIDTHDVITITTPRP